MIFDLFVQTAYAATEAVQHTAEVASGSVGPVQLLGLDFRLFIAQLINFVIVLLVLWKWVFGPIGKRLEERAAKIEQSERDSADIAAKHREAEEFRLAEIEKARDQAADIIKQAQKHAEDAKQKIMVEARVSSEKLIEQTKAQLQSEKEKLIGEVREEAANMVVLAVERIVGQRLDDKKDKELIQQSLEKVK
jgi:F-type H+-transporting ATPase subunit b